MAGAKAASDAKTGQSASKQRLISYAEAGVEAVREEMRHNASIFYMGQGIGVRGGNFQQSRGLWDEFGGERVRDTPIAERGQTGLGIGAALAGSRPIVDIVFLDFVLEAICEIIQQASTIHYISDGKFKVPLVVRAAGGGIRSTGPHHSHTFYSFFMHIPGLKVALPATPFDVKGLLKSTLRDDNPVIFIEHKALYNIKGHVPEDEYFIPFGKAVVCHPGQQVTLVAMSLMVHKAMQAAARLEQEGISVEVIDPRTLAPFDKETILNSVAKTGHLVIVDEAYASCGVSSEIAAIVAGEALYELDAPILRICTLPAPHAFSPALDNYLVPSVDRIVSEVAGLFGKKL